ncbi:hypothetical protein BN971_04447 [Mycobacterium rhizamassiliense]|jgi:hypothetical protein|uniref:Uncharacterized protein n=1 Tax=Mycobacterium rhizamassiliense TaxID=1841860 RepID=A0A2U3P220_9MYCO|nr:hypothetical protein [Mycobacterium rhizamassiliense]SPM37811.1 hypothetical protein BN971_04447 [Mycobacterium rhizamassiliense]
MISFSLGVYAFLTLLFLALAILFAVIATFYVCRLERRPANPIGDEIGSAKTVLRKVRKDEPISAEELDYAKEIVGIRSSALTFSIPATLFSLGCFYVFGSLYHLHGATPSERTFLGVFPMLASMNFTTQILRSIRMKRRLQKLP